MHHGIHYTICISYLTEQDRNANVHMYALNSNLNMAFKIAMIKQNSMARANAPVLQHAMTLTLWASTEN